MIYNLYSVKNLSFILNNNRKLIKLYDTKIKNIAKKYYEYFINFTKKPTCTIRKIKDKNIYLLNENENRIFLKAVEYRLKKVYKLKSSNKNNIISSIKNILLEENKDIKIIKTDIENFYESINLRDILNKIKKDMILSSHEFKIFEEIMLSPQIDCLPRGFSISPLLAELYMEKFDKKIVESYKNIFYYARYVDDIIIFYYDSLNIEDIENCLNNLKFNKLKTTYKINDFEYLGYHFQNKKNILLSNKKIKKIKTRIILTIKDFEKNKNKSLLEDRIKFLTTNWKIKKNARLYNGIYYNNIYITDSKSLIELDKFLQKRYKCNYFFKKGFDSKIITENFTNTFDIIKKIWN